jgi:UDP-N-acetylmuramoyl-tripeptide--D-alanyl-D-alanine ligase
VRFVLTEKAVRSALGLDGGSEAVRYSSIATDTRTLPPGALFVALKGERFDAHQFLPAARDAGAVAAVVETGTPPLAGLVLHQVPDPLRGYGLLARARRRSISGPVIAITGTNGKTSTKELVAAVLRTRWATPATRANLNKLVGVPQTILEAAPDTQALVIEAGANLPGEIARYREIIEPDIAIVTNAAAGHLEGFGSLDAVVAEKLELVRSVPVALVGTQPASLENGSRERGAARVVTVGLEQAQVKPNRISLGFDARPTLEIDGFRITVPLLGLHQAGNALFAWAVARELRLDPTRCAAALETVRLPAGRGEVIQQGGFTIVHDAYNANPASFRTTIEVADRLRSGRRLVFVAGTMRELGPDSERLHREIAELLVRLEPDLLAVVGEFQPALAPWAPELGDRLLTAEDAPSLAPRLVERLSGDELIVLKASRGVALERILPAIASRAAPTSEA